MVQRNNHAKPRVQLGSAKRNMGGKGPFLQNRENRGVLSVSLGSLGRIRLESSTDRFSRLVTGASEVVFGNQHDDGEVQAASLRKRSKTQRLSLSLDSC